MTFKTKLHCLSHRQITFLSLVTVTSVGEDLTFFPITARCGIIQMPPRSPTPWSIHKNPAFQCHPILASHGCQSSDEVAEMSFPGGSVVKNPAANAGDLGLIPGPGGSPGGGNGNPLQYSGLENPTDRGAWQATVHGVAKSQT